MARSTLLLEAGNFINRKSPDASLRVRAKKMSSSDQTTKDSYPSQFLRLASSSSKVDGADCLSGTRRYAASMRRRRELQSQRGWYRASLARTLAKEIRSLLCRIRELRRDQLDHRGVVINPLHQTRASHLVRQHAIDSCSEDMHSLCVHRPHMTPVDYELFAEAWALGACWAFHNTGSEPVA